MRIGLFTDIYLPTVFGTELATERVRKTLAGMGHRVYVFAPETPGYRDESRQVFRFRSQRIPSNPESRLAFSFLPVGRSYREVLDFHLDVAQAQTVGAMGMLARRMAQHQGIPLLYAHHSMYPAYAGSESADAQLVPSLVRTYTKWFAGRADAILAPTLKVKRLLSDWGIVQDIPVHVLPTGVDPSVFHRNAESGRRTRAALGIPEDRTVLLTVSRLVREKNLDLLLDSFRKIARADPRTLLLIVGEGSYRGHLEKHARGLGIASRTIFAGLVPHEAVPAFYRAADIFLFPSVIESQGLVVLEALASGLPVIAPRDDAYEQFLSGGLTGRLVSPATASAFARSTLELAGDRRLRARLARAAVRLSREYTLDKMAEDLVEIYRVTIQQVRGRRKSTGHARSGRPRSGRPSKGAHR